MTLETNLNSYQDLVEYAEANIGVECLYLKNSHFVRLVGGFTFDLYRRVVLQDYKGKVFISVGRMQVRPEYRTYGFSGSPIQDRPYRPAQFNESFCGHCGARKS